MGDYFVDHFLDGPEPWDSRVRIRLVPPLGYLDFLHLMSCAKVVLTDSGGVQEETTILGVPCITLRENTERPVTLTHGTNVLVGSDSERIMHEFARVLTGIRELRGHRNSGTVARLNELSKLSSRMRSRRSKSIFRTGALEQSRATFGMPDSKL